MIPPPAAKTLQVYTVGPRYAHAEARKSPVVDGKVVRSANGKELRFPVLLSPQARHCTALARHAPDAESSAGSTRMAHRIGCLETPSWLCLPALHRRPAVPSRVQYSGVWM